MNEALRRLFRRQPQDLETALRLAHGQEVDPAELESLKKAGIVRGSGRRPLSPNMLAALLYLERLLDKTGILLALKNLLVEARSTEQRQEIIESLTEELRSLKSGVEGDIDLLPLLEEVKESLSSLQPDEADPALVMEAVALVAEIIELIAKSLTPTKSKPQAPKLPQATVADWAAALDRVPQLSGPLALPSALQLGQALLGDRPPISAPSRAPSWSQGPDRRDEAQLALVAEDPAESLFSGDDRQAAMERHAALASLGRQGLKESGHYPSLTMRSFTAVAAGDLIEEQ
jgi:hypothetical protein